MTTTSSTGTARAAGRSAFDRFEAAGWERRAAGYDDFFTGITTRVADPLLDSVGAGPGTRLIDLACGPGHVAGRASQRGATATGIDVSSAMVALAARRWPAAAFRQGDVQRLPFGDATFDGAVASFVVMHVGRPELFAAEAARVLTPGGRLGVSAWDEPARVAIFRLVLDAVEGCGLAPPANVPAGPAFFRFADEDELGGLLTSAGLVEMSVVTVAFEHTVPDGAVLYDSLVAGTVRTSAMLSEHPPADRVRLRDRFVELADAHRRDGVLHLPASVKVATGTKR